MRGVLSISRRYLARSEQHRSQRRLRNEQNWMAYRGEQDFSHKAEYQNRETTPSFPIFCEQIVGTFERALTDSDDWLLAEPCGVGQPLLDADTVGKLLQFFLTRLWQPGNHPETAYGIQCLVGDAVKRGLMEPVVVAKVYPVLVKRRMYRTELAEPEAEHGDFPAYDYVKPTKKLKPVTVETMRLAITLLPWDDYYPDPSAACRYEIHRTRRHLSELLANPDYDQEVVRKLLGRANESWEKLDKAKQRGERSVGPDPYEVEVYEGWGDLIDEGTGEVIEVDGVVCENVFWAWAGGELLRKPTPNPFHDGTRPFIAAPLLRIPGSAEHKALADHAVPMWRASNELVNHFLDGAGRAAWGIGQARPDIMEAPEEIADGVPPGYTAVLKPNVVLGAKFYERVDNGEVPYQALEGMNRLEGFLQEALAMPDTKLGQVAQRQVKATEIVQAMAGSGSLYDSFAARFEDTFLEPLFEKAWKIVVQYIDTFVEEELVQILGANRTLLLEQMAPADRWQLLHKTHFKVRGIRGVASQQLRFNKLMQLANLLATNPQFADHFGQNYDYAKLWDDLLRSSGVDPAMYELEDEPEAEPPLGEDANALAAAEQQYAGGQLDPTLAAGSGASAPNLENPQGAQGAMSGLAPNNPSGGAAVAPIG